MTVTAGFFYLFSAVTIASAFMVIASRNPVHSVLFLILAFFNSAGLFVLLGAEFLAMVLVVVYVGAVAVLFLFVVMMLDVDFAQLKGEFARYLPLAGLIAIVLLAQLAIAFGGWEASSQAEGLRTAPIVAESLNTNALGLLLYDRYLLPFQVAGLILLVAMIGAIVLTHRSRGDTRGQRINRQIDRNPKEAIRNVNPPVGEGMTL